MEHYKLILIFAAVIKHGSMNAAAPHLGMTASAVSQHLRNLEKHYNIKLLHRTTRKLQLTEAGKLLLQYAQKLQQLTQETDLAMQNLQSEPQGEIRISLPSGFMKSAVMANSLQAIRQRFPHIQVTLIANDEYVDLIDENIDIALRVGEQSGQLDTIERLLARWKLLLCASPQYLQRHPIVKIEDLYYAVWLNPHDKILQSILTTLGLPSELPPNRINCTASVESSTMLAMAGLGVTLALDGEIQTFVQQGQLQILFPDNLLPYKNIYAVTSHRQYSAKVAAVLEILKENFQSSEKK